MRDKKNNPTKEERWKALDAIISGGWNRGIGYTREDLLKELENRINAQVSIRTLQSDIDKLKEMTIGGVTLIKTFLGDGSRHRKIVYSYEGREKYSVYGSGLGEEDLGILVLASSVITSFSGLEISDALKEIVEGLIDKTKLKGIGKISSILKLDENPEVGGLEHLHKILVATWQKKVLRLKYKDFSGNEFNDIYVHPYFVKMWRSRYYLFGLNEEARKIHNYPLDRIVQIDDIFGKQISYNESRRVESDEYLKDVVGVSVYDKELQEIQFQVPEHRIKYVTSKPIHSSQEYYEDTKTFSILVKPNRELKSELNYLDAELITDNVDFDPPKPKEQ